MIINRYCDPGHSWFKVSRALLKRLDIEDKISSYSYQRKDMAYLEEDCDADILLTALEAKGLEYKIKEYHTNRCSKITRYEDYRSIKNDNQ